MRACLAAFFLLLCAPIFCAVQKFTLDNGLKLVVKEDHRAPVAVVMLWYNVGSADEPGGMTGVSHALEHLMFKGTPKFPQGVFTKKIAALGGQENAMTNYDYTAYYEKVAANQLPTAFELEADRMQNLTLDNTEFAREIKVIQEERRMRTDDNPQALAFERFLATAHLADPYHHPVIGWMSDLHQMTIQDVRSWYNNFYTPNNATLVVVGDVDANHVYELARLYFAAIPRKADFIRKKQLEPQSLGGKSVAIHASAKLPALFLGYTVPAASNSKKGWEPYALEVIGGILDAGESARLTSDLIRQKHLASNVGVYYNLYSRYQTQFVLIASPVPDKSTDDLKKSLLNEIKRLQTETVGEDELNRVKTQLIAQKTFEKDSILGQATEIGLLETLGLGLETADAYTGRIRAITPEQIKEAAQRYFNENALTEARLLPLNGQSKELSHEKN